MNRLDKQLIEMNEQLETARMTGDETEVTDLQQRISKREEQLLPLYLQVAHQFADLHDRPGRMKAKGVIREVVDWPSSREYFYWRLRRRLAEDALCKEWQAADSNLSYSDMRGKLQQLLQERGVEWDDDKACIDAYANGDVLGDELAAAKKEVSPPRCNNSYHSWMLTV